MRFDLREEPWLPVLWKDGTTTEVGLRELFTRAHEITDLVVPYPPVASGLWRILYAITARVTGLDEALPAGAWRKKRERLITDGRFSEEQVKHYFDAQGSRFDLFDPERPWLQDPRLREECPQPSGINKLVLGRPSGQNQVWFAHFTDLDPRPVPAKEAAWWLIAQLYYGPSGLCSAREVRGKKFRNSLAGPLRSVLSFHPLGRNLFESLIAGLPTPEDSKGRGHVSDLCPWEDDLPDPLGVPKPLGWPCGILTRRAHHAVLLVPNDAGTHVVDAYVTWGTRKATEPVTDPYVFYRTQEDGTQSQVRADAARALWRDLDALLYQDSVGHDAWRRQRPQVIKNCIGLPYQDFLRFRVFGFDQDGQTRDKQWFSAVTPEILQWVEEEDPETAGAVSTLHQSAEQTANILLGGLRTAWRTVYKIEAKQYMGEPWPARAAAHYWPRAEREFWDRVEHRERRNLERPATVFRRIARDIVDQFIDEEIRNPVAVRELTKVYRNLGGGYRKEQTVPPEPQTKNPSGQQSDNPLNKYDRFVSYIHEACKDPGNRAALRSGIRTPPEKAHKMHPIVARRLPSGELSDGQERAYYTIASLIAAQKNGRSASAPQVPEPTPDRQEEPTGEEKTKDNGDGKANNTKQQRKNLGWSLAYGLNTQKLNEKTVESRLHLLVRQRVEGLHDKLPPFILYLRSKEIPIDWGQLLKDLIDWPRRKDAVAKQWLQTFYLHLNENNSTNNKSDKDE